MKENLRKLQLIFKLTALSPEMFYSISVMSGISLQGNMKASTIAELEKLRFSLSVDERGYLIGSRNAIDICLT